MEVMGFKGGFSMIILAIICTLLSLHSSRYISRIWECKASFLCTKFLLVWLLTKEESTKDHPITFLILTLYHRRQLRIPRWLLLIWWEDLPIQAMRQEDLHIFLKALGFLRQVQFICLKVQDHSRTLWYQVLLSKKLKDLGMEQKKK
jgi:hypothetical protein